MDPFVSYQCFLNLYIVKVITQIPNKPYSIVILSFESFYNSPNLIAKLGKTKS